MPTDFQKTYDEYRRLFPDAEDPGGLVSGLGIQGMMDLVEQAVREKKKIVILHDPERLDWMDYRLESPE